MTKKIVERLLGENSEYRNNYQDNRRRMIPRLVFWRYEHPDYFRVGGKQKWTLKVQIK